MFYIIDNFNFFHNIFLHVNVITILIVMLHLKDIVKLGSIFYFFWREYLVDGNAKFIDPKDNIFSVHLSKDPSGKEIFLGGMLEVAKFYKLILNHEV